MRYSFLLFTTGMTPYEVGEKFVAWTKKKIRHHLNQEKREVYFEEREIWWAALGKKYWI